MPGSPFHEPSAPRQSSLSRKRRRHRILAIRYFPELETLECLVLPSAVTWSAVGSDGESPAPGDWSNFQNWTDGRGFHRLPGPGDDVSINAPGVIVDHYTGLDTIRSLNLVGELIIDGGTLTVTNGIHLEDAVLRLGPTATLAISGTQSLTGTGSVVFSSNHPGSEIELSKDTTWTVGSGITVNGNTGTIGPAPGAFDDFGVVNEGEVGCTAPGGSLTLSGGTWTNKGIIEALDGGTTELDPATLSNVSDATLSDGTWKVSGGNSVLKVDMPPIAINDATILLDGADAALTGIDNSSNLLADLTSNEGGLTLQHGATLTNSGALGNSGHLDVETDSVLNVGGIYTQTAGTTIVNGLLTSTAFTTNIEGGTLQGNGTVDTVIYPPTAAPDGLHHQTQTATITLGGLTQTYDGSPRPVTVTTVPAGLDVSITYNGSDTPPTHPGTYVVSATIEDPYYVGTATGTLVIGKATPTVTVTPVDVTYDGKPHGTMGEVFGVSGVGLGPADIGYSSIAVPIDAGNYVATASFAGNEDYTSQTKTAPIQIERASATVQVTALSATYDGLSHATTALVTGAGGVDLGSAAITYNTPDGAPPVDAGTYIATGTFAGNTNYTSATGSTTITIGRATPTVTVTPVIVDAFDGLPHGTTGVVTGVNGASLGSAVITYNTADGTAPVDAGSYIATGTFAGNTDYISASGTAPITIGHALPAHIDVPSVNAVYDGTAHGTAGEVFGVDGTDLGPASITYSSGSPPVDAGSYTATASFAGNQNYAATSATATISIASAAPTIEIAPVTVTYDGQPHGTTAEVFGVDHVDLGPAVVSYSSDTLPVDAGTFTVTATFAGNANYASGSTTGSITISLATAGVTLENLDQIYSGQPETVTATTDPAGLTVTVTYNGSSTPPTLPGAYAVTATISDPNYTGSASGTLAINGAASITSVSTASFTEVKDGSFVVKTGGFPLPTLTESGALPAGLTFIDNHDGTATISGVPAEDTEGTYLLDITAANSAGASASHTLVLNVLTADQSGDLLASVTVLTKNGKALAAVPALEDGQAFVKLAVPDDTLAALWLASFLGNPAPQDPVLATPPTIITITPTGARAVELTIEHDLVYVDTRVNGVDNVNGATATALFTFPGSAISPAGLSAFTMQYWNGTSWQDVLSTGPDGLPVKPVPQPGVDASGNPIWTITIVFDANSTPTIKGLKGTVFTLALPTTMATTTTVISPPQVFISTRAITDTGNGLASSATFASTGQVNLLLRVSNQTEFTASRTAVGGGLEGDITILPDSDDIVPWLRDVPWLWDMVRPGSPPPAARPRQGAAAPPAQPGPGGSAGQTTVPLPADESDVIAIDSFFTDPEPAVPEELSIELSLAHDPDPNISMAPRGNPPATWGFPLAAGAIALSVTREKPPRKSWRYRPAIEARR